MNYFYDLPSDIRDYILIILKKNSSVNCIIRSWRRYFNYKNFIYYMANQSPVYNSIFDDQLIYDVSHPYTRYYFHLFSNIFTGNESKFSSIYILFYMFAVSINDYELSNNTNNIYYIFNKLYCTHVASEFNWNSILNILD